MAPGYDAHAATIVAEFNDAADNKTVAAQEVKTEDTILAAATGLVSASNAALLSVM